MIFAPLPPGFRRSVVAVASAAALTLGTLAVSAPAQAAPAAAAVAPAPLAVDGLTTNGRVNPLGIPGADPTFGWVSTSAGRGQVQSAYEIRVGTSAGAADVWSSGKVVSDQQVDAAYAGPDLTTATRYHWQVRVWNGGDQASDWSPAAWFETGLLTAADWTGADWVGAPASAELDKWADYEAEFDFELTNLVFAPFIRSRDLNNGYMWQLSVADGTPRFRPHARTNGTYSLLANIDISAHTSVAALTTGTHTLKVRVQGNQIITSLDGTVIDTRTHAAHPKGFVGFRSVNATEGPERSKVRRVTVKTLGGATLLDTNFSTGNPFNVGTVTDGALVINGQMEGLWKVPVPNKPLLRTTFATESGKTIRSARVYAAARGVYELNLNGDKVGDQHLAPGWTDYRTLIQHQTYDVTDQIDAGSNAFGAELGDGWWSGKVAHYGTKNYGDTNSLIAGLRIDYTDGTSQWVRTDPTWLTAPGPYVEADLIQGESYDARAVKNGWTGAGYDASSWSPVAVLPTATPKLAPQPDEPVRETESRVAQKRTEPTAGKYIYDLGQNMVGIARMRLTGAAGQTFQIRYGEELNPDGTLYTANLRGAKVTDYYTFAGAGTITYEPKFTFHGFRYLEISAVGSTIATPPAAGDVTGLVWGSDLTNTGTLETSSAMLNKLQSNITWGQRGNFLSIPTDTPARDERLGWTGDINVFAPTASFNQDTRSFLRKWLVDLRTTQMANGDVSGIAPDPRPGTCCGGATGWSDAMITVPHTIWMSYGDTAAVRENYAAMEKYFNFVRTSAGADLIQDRGGYLDWLHLDDPTPAGVLGTAYYAENARMMSEMAAAIGRDADAASYATLSTQIRAAFATAFVGADGTITGNSQAGYAMALGMDLVPAAKRSAVADKYVAKIAASGGHLRTGFLGTPWLLTGLSGAGKVEEAYTLMNREEYPSWGFEVKMGATTMWERWNSIMPDGSFGPVDMNSFNHYAYGAVGDWMYRNIGGIAPAEAGYKKSRIAPIPGGGITSAKASFASAYGAITTDWATTDSGLRLTASVPVNTTADVVLPAESIWAVTEGGDFLEDVDGVQGVELTDAGVVVTVGSGTYEFVVDDQLGGLGAILDRIAALETHVDGLAEDGDLSGADRAAFVAGLDRTSTALKAAIAAQAAGNASEYAAKLATAVAEIRGLAEWLEAATTVEAPVKADLRNRLRALVALLDASLTSTTGATVSLPPAAATAQPGEEVTGSLVIANAGTEALSALSLDVTVRNWPVELIDPPTSIPAGGQATVAFTTTVPATAAPGSAAAEAEVSFTVAGTTYRTGTRTAEWLTIESPLEITAATFEHPVAGSIERGLAKATVRNPGSVDIAGQVVLDLPDGWPAPASSSRVIVPAGGSLDVEVPFFVPISTVDGKFTPAATFVAGGAELARRGGEITLATVPPTGELLDHVDFGDAASENAHGIQASPNSARANEAGLTRRYTHQGFPGGWFSAEIAVEPGEPFVFAVRDTFNGAVTKKYRIFVDDVLVDDRTLVRTTPGVGVEAYRLVVDDPAVLANDGTVRVRFEHPVAYAAYHDPSIADLWVLPLAADDVAPEASATASGTPGTAGWWRGPVEVSVDALDNRAGVRAEVGTANGWATYSTPVRIAEDGRHTVDFRAVDAAGLRSGARSLPVWIDSTAPATDLSVRRGSDQPERAELRLTATDATSGVASTRYRIDNGPWLVADTAPVVVTGFGEHVVEFFSTDAAGNAETVRRSVVTIDDVATLAAVVQPVLRGRTTVGQVLSVTAPVWNTAGVTTTQQWLRNGNPIARATGSSYRLTAQDAGARISVRTTGAKSGLTSVSLQTAAPGSVTKAKAAVKVTVRPGKPKAGKQARVTIVVTAPGVAATGRVQVRIRGKIVGTRTLSGGRVTLKVRMPKKKGAAPVVVRYLGNAGVTTATKRVRVRIR